MMGKNRKRQSIVSVCFCLTAIVVSLNIVVTFYCHKIVNEHHQGGRESAGPFRNLLRSFQKGDTGPTDDEDRDETELPVFAICLLTRDDLPILPEWIAYHYHAVQLKHLVMAVDPTSKDDPEEILENFRKHLPELQIEKWTDKDFMPDYFVQGDYGRAPNFYGKKGEFNDTETWYEHYSKLPHFGPFRIRDQTIINSHRYRQTRFLSRCGEHLKKLYDDQTVWMSTLDSDEYLAANPWMMPPKQQSPFKMSSSVQNLEAGSLLHWWVDTSKQQKQLRLSTNTTIDGSICRQIPRLLFGAVELVNQTETTPEERRKDVTSSLVRRNNKVELLSNLERPKSSMETLRWKFHAAPDDEKNFQQKVVLDLHKIPEDDEIWGDHVRTVHRPSRKLCSPEVDTNVNGTMLVPTTSSVTIASPVVAFHYIGSEARYFARPQDRRRNAKRYRERSMITYGRDKSGWIDQWLERFVDHVGIDTAAALLPDHIIDVN